jgi:hypothetical protein
VTKTSKIVLAVIVAVALVFGLTGFVGAAKPPSPPGQDKQAQIELIEGAIPAGVMPVYVLSGSDYEIGYQYGYQAGPYIAAHLNLKLDAIARYRAYDLDADPLTPKTGITTKSDLDWVLAGFHQYMEIWTPEAVEQMKGMADGSTDAGYPIDYGEALLLQWCTYAMRDALNNPASRLDPSGDLPKAGKSRVPENYFAHNSLSADADAFLANLEMFEDGNCCTQCAATGSRMANTGETIVGSAWDWHFRYEAILAVFPDDGHSYTISGKIGSLGEGQWMNSAGCAAMFD